ncbi:acetyl-CoA synthetase-like protein [Earliella scabrosa]|nr:acetyl-CoA synthetase-like protein [Earliella scabrosa]
MRPFEGTPSTYAWGLITYQDFLDALRTATAYWADTLNTRGVKRGDVVSMWLKGSHWSDLANIYAVAAAGFVPEVFGLPFTPLFVQELLAVHNAPALIYDPAFQQSLGDAQWEQCTIPLPKLGDMPAPPKIIGPPPEVQEDDVAMIFHTSGTTGGRPKPVPQTHKWLIAEAEVTWKCVIQSHPEGQHVFNNIGSFASIGAASCVTFMSWSGACLTQSAGREITADEFLAMVEKCGLNFLLQYAPWMQKLLAAARQRPEILQALRGMQQIAYTGATLNPEDEQWALKEGIPLTPMYANTECGPLMIARLGSGESYLRPAHIVDCRLVPVAPDDGASPASTALQLYDFHVLGSAKTCPHPSIRNRPDGHVTGDLFEEVKPGCYVFRGRSDDWIRCGGNPAFCDTKAIEENAMKTCRDLIHNCVVVGHQKICPILVVEPEPEPSVDVSTPDAAAKVKSAIIERTAAFNERLFAHERITTPECILFVPAGSLPRTSEKGNVRRKATEEQFTAELDTIYQSLI